jgi:hypothetical protein
LPTASTPTCIPASLIQRSIALTAVCRSQVGDCQRISGVAVLCQGFGAVDDLRAEPAAINGRTHAES